MDIPDELRRSLILMEIEPERTLLMMGVELENLENAVKWVNHAQAIMPWIDVLEVIDQIIGYPKERAKDMQEMLEEINKPKNRRKLKSRNFKIKGMNERKYLEMTRGD